MNVPIEIPGSIDGFAIPPQPKIVTDLSKLLDQPGTSSAQIAAIIGRDASLTAQMLKVVNSPFFSRGRSIDSVGQALNVIGLGNFKTIVLKSALQQVLPQKDKTTFESFWRHSELAAICCEIIAKRCAPELTQNAYIAGLFHDCAIPVMFAKYDNYGAIFPMVLNCETIIHREDDLYATNHCVIGYFFAKS